MAGEWIAILAVLTFVGSNVIFRRTEKEASPTFINFIRTAIGTITFFLLSFIFNIFFKIFLLPWELWILLFASFLFGQVIGDTSYFQAQKELGTTIALAISMTFPLFTFILSLIFLNQPFKVNLLISLILISTGIIIIGKTRTKLENNNDKEDNDKEDYKSLSLKIREFFSKTSFKALMFGLVAAIGWAIGLVMIDFATNEIDRLLSNGLSSIIGNVIRFPFALLILSSMVFSESYYQKKGKIEPTQKKNIKTWALLIFAAILGTSIGAYLYTEAARTAHATVMSLIASAAPLFSLPLTYWLNKEKITKFGFLGVILTIIGVVIIIITGEP
ncbi:MAG: DMT family transporter [Candidatus Hermodarchaeota archaeon]